MMTKELFSFESKLINNYLASSTIIATMQHWRSGALVDRHHLFAVDLFSLSGRDKLLLRVGATEHSLAEPIGGECAHLTVAEDPNVKVSTACHEHGDHFEDAEPHFARELELDEDITIYQRKTWWMGR